MCFIYPIGSAIVSARLLADVSEDAAVNVQDQAVEKSERCPNNSSLFLPQAAVVVVAVQVPLSAQQRASKRAIVKWHAITVVLLVDIPKSLGTAG